MADQTLAKVDYQKPLEDIPYKDVAAAKKRYHADVKDRLCEIFERENVTDDPDVLEKYSRDTSLDRFGRPSFVVFPQTTEQISALLHYANEIKLPVVPVSSGTHNYGAALPRMGGVIVELSGWKDIHTIDRRNRAVRIAPGVTYDQLQKALREKGLRALCPLLPRKDQSVLTAHLEAHPMLIPEFNYSEPLYTAEIVMPSGELFRTGSAAVAPAEQTQTDMVGPWGPGLDWNRLYTRSQGTLGIITWANIMAEPLPSQQKLFFTCSSRIDDLVHFTGRLQKKWIGYECCILNRANLASILGGSPAEADRLQAKLPGFVQIFRIGGLKRFPDERIAYQEADLMETSQECGLNPRATIPEAPRAADFFEKNLGQCWDGEVYWKDMRKGACADIFFITTMNRAGDFIQTMQQQAADAGCNYQDIGIYLQPIENGRAAHLEFSIPYCPDDPRECTRVRELHCSASEAMHALGAVFTRAYGAWAQMAHGRNAAHYTTAKTIKDIIDKNNIMNPGKLGL
jgi:FAD/FMN-containing dehydrogenase